MTQMSVQARLRTLLCCPRFSIFPNPSRFESITNLVAFYLLIKFSLLRILPSENPSPEISGGKTWKIGKEVQFPTSLELVEDPGPAL